MLKAVDSIKPIEEYRDFIGKHKYIYNIIIISVPKIYIYLNIDIANFIVNVELDQHLRSDLHLMRILWMTLQGNYRQIS